MKRKGKVDRPLLISLLILVGLGLVMVFSASMYTSTVENDGGISIFLKQLLFVVLGLVVLRFVSTINYRRFKSERFSYILMGITAILLVLVLIAGTEVNNAKRWLSLGFMTFQPSELAKVAGIVYMSALIAREPEVLNKGKEFLTKCILPIAILCGLTAIEPSLSAALAIAFGMIVVIFVAGVEWKVFGPYIAIGVVGIVGLLFKEPWRLERIKVFWGSGSLDYQINQSLLAIGTGGLFGKGLGNGMQKYLFLPELQNDFIFANIAEELGMFGCLIVIVLFIYIIRRGLIIADKIPDKFGSLYATAVMSLLGYQVLINIGVATSAMPVTGMALPFVSAGGSSMLVLFAMIGPILNMSRELDLIERKSR